MCLVTLVAKCMNGVNILERERLAWGDKKKLEDGLTGVSTV